VALEGTQLDLFWEGTKGFQGLAIRPTSSEGHSGCHGEKGPDALRHCS
jgi:hypothetical protein